MRHQCSAKNASAKLQDHPKRRCYTWMDIGASHAGEESVLVAARELVGEWLSLVEHLVRDTTEHGDLESKSLIRRCFSTEILIETY